MAVEQTVLVVEDEEAFIEALKVGLSREGFTVKVARDGKEALDRFDEFDPDLVLLDLMLPKLSGVDVCHELRNRSTVPIIMVTARSSEVDTVVGLEVGADDYVTKPYRIRELVARMRAVLRRYEEVASPVEEPSSPDGERSLFVDDVVLDPASHEVTIRGDQVSMPLKEFELLRMLMFNSGRVLSRDQLIDRIWGHDYVGDTKTLDVHIKRLRSKVEIESSNPKKIITIRGLGYKYEKAKEARRG